MSFRDHYRRLLDRDPRNVTPDRDWGLGGGIGSAIDSIWT